MARHPRQAARLYVGDVYAGPNPKVNNILRAYHEAANDWILISDSNVRVEPRYLDDVVEPFGREEVGVVTAIVAGHDPEGPGGWLEAVFLNTFYARWMMISSAMGLPVVIGKSMLFRRSEAKRFGGMAVLGRYLAEDYMAGQAMRRLGRRVEIMRRPVPQPIGDYSLKAFWKRHIRWGRIRKSQAPQAFAVEPWLSFWPAGLVGAFSAHALFGFPVEAVLAIHLVLWGASDLAMMWLVSGGIDPRAVLAWFARETLHIPLWIHIAFGRSVDWRGQRLTLARGGMLKAPDA